MNLIPILTAAPIALITLGLTGCGSDSGSADAAVTPATAPNLAGGYAMSYVAPPLPIIVPAGMPNIFPASRTATFSSDVSVAAVDDSVRFNLLLEQDGKGGYTGTYSDDSGLYESVSGTNSRLVIEFKSRTSLLDDRLLRTGTITLTNPVLNAQRELIADISFKFDDSLSDGSSRKRQGSGNCSSRRNSSDDSMSGTGSNSSGGVGSSDDEARIPGLWQAVSKATYENSGEQLLLTRDKKVSIGGTVVPNSSWKFKPGEPEGLDIVIPGSRTYVLTDVKQRGTVATGSILVGEAKTKYAVVLRKLQ